MVAVREATRGREAAMGVGRVAAVREAVVAVRRWRGLAW